MLHNVSAIKNQSLFFGHFLSSRDNLTSLSRNVLLLSNFKNLFFALKHVFWTKITIRQIFDCLVGHTTKKEKKNSSHETSQTSAQFQKRPEHTILFGFLIFFLKLKCITFLRASRLELLSPLFVY